MNNFTEKEMIFFKKYSIKIDLDNTKELKLIPNRISEIIIQKQISPLLDENDIKKMNLRDEQHWFNILRNNEGIEVFGERGCLFKIADWLNVELCDIYGMCFLKSNGNINTDCGDCKSKIKK